jgi:predicted HicB family RNase H-like nuclease
MPDRRVDPRWTIQESVIERAQEQAKREAISTSSWVNRQLTMLLDKMDKLENTKIGGDA